MQRRATSDERRTITGSCIRQTRTTMMKRIVSQNSPHNNHRKKRRIATGYCCCTVLIASVIIGTLYMNQTWDRITIRTAIYSQARNKTTSVLTNSMQSSSSATTVTNGSQQRFTNSSKNTGSRTKSNTIFPAVTLVDASSLANGQQIQRPHRVLAYGDSLTAGTSGYSLFPYSVYLEQALHERQKQLKNEDDAIDGDYRNIVVRHRGIPGMKVQEMVDDLDGEQRGLRYAIQTITDPSLSVVIILAGTNDIGYELIYNSNNVEVAAHQIFTNLIALHQMCYDNDVPYTIAIGIPSSGYQHRVVDAANVASKVNEKLQQYARASLTEIGDTINNANDESTETTTSASPSIVAPLPIDKKGRSRMIYMDFPFEYIPGGENWNSDTLHFSQRGYEALGQSLAPLVEQIAYQFLREES